MRLTLPSIVLLLLVSASCKQQTEKATGVITDDVKARIDATLKSFVDTNRVAGISALIFEKKPGGVLQFLWNGRPRS